MEIKKKEKNLVDNYINTISRFTISNIPKNNYLKLPYNDEILLKLTSINNDYELIDKITNKLIKKNLSNEDILFVINQFFILTKEQKNNIFKFLNNDHDNNLLRNNIEIILFNIKYTRLYLIIIEFLFDNKIEDNELYFYFYILINNNKEDLEIYTNKYFKFRIISFYFQELFTFYKKIYKSLYSNNLIEECNEKKLFHNLIKTCLYNWYKIYLKDIENKNVNNKIDIFIIKKKSIFNNFLCSKDMYSF
jgi:hypothetical protein